MIVEYTVSLGGGVDIEVLDRQGEGCQLGIMASRIGSILSEDTFALDDYVHECSHE
jgi:hypothetical protein